jgi:Astacin (Peptidase family M12A)/Bacterial Ig-like domain (group 3)/MBG domain (YGX type)/Chitobiase/beta-hexosaminidase C-terminal domain
VDEPGVEVFDFRRNVPLLFVAIALATAASAQPGRNGPAPDTIGNSRERAQNPENSSRSIFQGDILLDRTAPNHLGRGPRPKSLGVAYPQSLWPRINGVATVFYVIDAASDPKATPNIDTAIATFNADFPNLIQWVAWTAADGPNYVDVNLNAEDFSGQCEASEGYDAIPAQPMTGSTSCTVGTILHEMGHVIGLWHEQTRPDRDTYVTVNYNNVIKGSWGNFEIATDNQQVLGLYDYASVMQYPPYSFSRNGGPVIETIPAGMPLSNVEGVPVPATIDYSAGDKETIRRLYGAPPTQVTVTSNPVGLQVDVDGETIVTPQTFAWALNSTHTLSVPSGVQTLSGDIEASTTSAAFYYTYGRWNDSTSQSHTITVAPGSGGSAFPTSAPQVATYSANFIQLVPYTSTVYPANSGQMSISPQPQSYTGVTGEFLTARQQATFTATPASGWNFYEFNNGPFWLPGGLGANPKTFYAPDTGNPVDPTAEFTNTPVYKVDVSPDPFSSNLGAVIDGGFWFTPKNFSSMYDSSWTAMSSHSLSLFSPDYPYSFNSRYVFSSWSDGGALTHSIASLPAASTSYIATLTPQFLPATNFDFPPCGGTAQLSPASATNDGFYPTGQVLNYRAAPDTSWTFAGWSFDLTGTANPTTLMANDETLVYANFNITNTPLTLTSLSPSTVAAGGSAFTLTLTGTGFAPGSIVFLNGRYPSVTYVNSTTLQVQVTTADVATPGAFQVYVENFPTGWNGCAVFGYQTFQVHGAKPATSTTATSSANPSTFGSTVSFTATVTSSGNSATGSVSFKDGLTVLGTGSLNGSGVATFTTSALAVGTHSITAVYAGDGSNVGSTSAALTQTVTQALQTITFAPISNVNYGVSAFALSATSSSGLPVTFKLDSGPATLSTGTLTITGVGTVMVEADQIGNSNYSPATAVIRSFTVAKAPLTVTVNSVSKTYGAAVPVFTGTISGLKNGDALTAAYSSTGTATSPVGAYPITATLSGAALSNYAPTTIAGTLSISKVALSVTAQNAVSVYGATALPPFTFALSGFVNGDTAGSATSGSPSLTTTATNKSAAGGYAINAAVGTLAAANYSFQFIPGTLTISKAVLTVTAGNTSRIYGSTSPAFVYSLTGLVNGDAATAISGAPALASVATASSAVGSYPITAAIGTLSATNYGFQFVPGTLTISKAVLTVSAANQGSVYGAALPALTYTFSGFVHGDTSASATTGAPSLTTTASAASRAGSYPITVAAGSLVATNYSIQFSNGTLTISKAVITVKANNASIVYGSAIPAFTDTLTGFVNGDTAASAFSGTPNLNCSATATSAAGNYTITPNVGTLAAANYSFAFTTGTLTISKAVLTVSANNAAVIYGSTLPALTYSLSGFLNGDTTSSAITGTPSLTTTATATSRTGSYPITPATGTLAATSYSFRLVVGNLTISKALLTVTANNTTRTYGATSPGFTATLTGFMNGDTPATATAGAASLISSATVKSPLGTYPITAGAGNLSATNYSFQFSPGILTIVQASLTVTALNHTSAYGAALPSLTYSLTGFVNGENATTATTGIPSLATVATAGSAAGTYSISSAAGTLAATNYSFTFVPGTLTISKAVLTVTAGNKTMVYGATLPVFTNTVTGFVNGDNASSAFTGAPAFNTTATASSPVGNYSITPATGTLAANNYSFKFTNGTLTISKAVLTISANSVVTSYGSSGLPTFSDSVSGLVNGDTVSTALTGAPAFTTPATSKSAAGVYTITASVGNLASTNYSFKFGNGTLTISKALLTVTANNATRSYGAALPALTYVLSGLVNGDSVSVVTGTPSLVTTAVAKSAVGSYPIAASLGSLKATSYVFQFVSAALNITPATLTVTAANKGIAYGGAIPALTYVLTGFLNGDTAATATTGVPILSTTATSTSAVGSYPITAAVGALTSTNYGFKFAAGTLTISRATLTVAAANKTMIYGSFTPVFTYTITGFANGDTAATATTGTPAFSTSASATPIVGTFTITPAIGTLIAANYTFKFTNGTMTVTKAPLAIAANNVSAVYNQPLPALTFSTTGFANGDTASVLSGTPTETTTAVPGSNVGSYPISITVGSLTAANYYFQFMPASLTITPIGPVATPLFSPVAGTYISAQTVSITDSTPGATIYYTINGATPTTTSTKYTVPLSVKTTETLQALAIATGYTPSPVARVIFTITP